MSCHRAHRREHSKHTDICSFQFLCYEYFYSSNKIDQKVHKFACFFRLLSQFPCRLEYGVSCVYGVFFCVCGLNELQLCDYGTIPKISQQIWINWMAHKCGKLKTDTKRVKSVLYEPFYEANSMCKSFKYVYMSGVCLCVCVSMCMNWARILWQPKRLTMVVTRMVWQRKRQIKIANFSVLIYTFPVSNGMSEPVMLALMLAICMSLSLSLSVCLNRMLHLFWHFHSKIYRKFILNMNMVPCLQWNEHISSWNQISFQFQIGSLNRNFPNKTQNLLCVCYCDADTIDF